MYLWLVQSFYILKRRFPYSSDNLLYWTMTWNMQVIVQNFSVHDTDGCFNEVTFLLVARLESP